MLWGNYRANSHFQVRPVALQTAWGLKVELSLFCHAFYPFKDDDIPGWPPVLQPLGRLRLPRFADTRLISVKFDPLPPTFSL